jgi:hypothetical protein
LQHPSRLALLKRVLAAQQALTDGQSSLNRVDRKLMMVGFCLARKPALVARPRRWAHLVHNLDDAIVAEVDNGATTIDYRRPIAGPIQYWRRTDVVWERLTLGWLPRDRDARTVADRAIIRGRGSRLAGLGRGWLETWRSKDAALGCGLVLGAAERSRSQ